MLTLRSNTTITRWYKVDISLNDGVGNLVIIDGTWKANGSASYGIDLSKSSWQVMLLSYHLIIYYVFFMYLLRLARYMCTEVCRKVLFM